MAGNPLLRAEQVRKLAEHLYSYLPGSSWAGTYTFAEAAAEVGVPKLWPGGSKQPALEALLSQTLTGHAGRFCPLILKIVQHGISYRGKKGDLVSRDDITDLNALVEALGFKIPELHDPAFLAGLPVRPRGESDAEERAVEDDEDASVLQAARERREVLELLRAEFFALEAEGNRQAAGIAFNGFLYRLFELSDLDPGSPFRIVGEEIDGSFVLDAEVYLIEAKWQKDKTQEKDLLVFRGKIEGKSSITRGLFVSVNGYTEEAIESITRGKQPNFMMFDGAHLMRVLQGEVVLDELIRLGLRALADRGRPYVPVRELVGS